MALSRLLLYKIYKISKGRLILCDYLFKKWKIAQRLSHLILASIQRGGIGCLFVLNEEIKDHKGYVTSPGSHSFRLQNWSSSPDAITPKPVLFTPHHSDDMYDARDQKSQEQTKSENNPNVDKLMND